VSPLLGNRRCHGNNFVLHALGGLPRVTFQVWTWYDLPVLTYFNFYLDTLRYVLTLTFDLLSLRSCHVIPLGWSIRVPSLNMIGLTFPELGRLQFSIDRQLKVPIFPFFGGGVKGSNFKFNLSNSQKALYWALGCVQKCDLWAWLRKENKRTETFMRQTGYLPRPPTST